MSGMIRLAANYSFRNVFRHTPKKATLTNQLLYCDSFFQPSSRKQAPKLTMHIPHKHYYLNGRTSGFSGGLDRSSEVVSIDGDDPFPAQSDGDRQVKCYRPNTAFKAADGNSVLEIVQQHFHLKFAWQ